MYSKEQVAAAVRKVLDENIVPVYETQDDRGLEESEYVDFVMQVLVKAVYTEKEAEKQRVAQLPSWVLQPFVNTMQTWIKRRKANRKSWTSGLIFEHIKANWPKMSEEEHDEILRRSLRD